MNGILLVDKPKGWTSFDVVAKVRNVIKHSLANEESQLTKGKIKVGHTGTLDPLATGLLVLLIGKATKMAPELSKADKTYQATIKLGFTSTTGDAEGTIIPSQPTFPRPGLGKGGQVPSEARIKKVIKEFEGEIEQVPPAFSAIKVNGQRAYKLSRQGKDVKIEPRKVKIYSISNVKINPSIRIISTIVDINSMPEVSFTVKVSSGTYIRTLAEDIGKALGTGSYLTNLKRTQVGRFDIKDAISVEKIGADEIKRLLIVSS